MKFPEKLGGIKPSFLGIKPLQLLQEIGRDFPAELHRSGLVNLCSGVLVWHPAEDGDESWFRTRHRIGLYYSFYIWVLYMVFFWISQKTINTIGT